MTCLLSFQPFPCEDGGQQAIDSRDEYCHAKEHSSKDGVKLPLVGLVQSGLLLVQSSVDWFGLTLVFVCVQGTLSRSEWEAAGKFI